METPTPSKRNLQELTRSRHDDHVDFDSEVSKIRTYLLLDGGYARQWWQIVIKALIVLCIFASVAAVLYETIPIDMDEKDTRDDVVFMIEVPVTIIFTLVRTDVASNGPSARLTCFPAKEMALRIWSCTVDTTLTTFTLCGKQFSRWDSKPGRKPSLA